MNPQGWKFCVAAVVFVCQLAAVGAAGEIQAPAIEWERSYGGSSGDFARAIQQTADGGYIVVGFSHSQDGDVTENHGKFDFWIVKLNLKGNIVWQKSLGGSRADTAHSVQQTTDGGYIVAGYSNSDDGDVSGHRGMYDYWVIKLDAEGNLIWQRTLGGKGMDMATSVQQTKDGGYIAIGFSYSDDGDVSGNHGDSDYWVVKLNGEGDIIWQKSLGGS